MCPASLHTGNAGWMGGNIPMPLFRRTRPLNAGTLPDEQGRFPWFTWLGGRRLYNRFPYVLPKDMSEVNRLDFQHYTC